MTDSDASDDVKPGDPEALFLEMLRDEGLRLLAAFRRIETRRHRDAVVKLAEALAPSSAE